MFLKNTSNESIIIYLIPLLLDSSFFSHFSQLYVTIDHIVCYLLTNCMLSFDHIYHQTGKFHGINH